MVNDILLFFCHGELTDSFKVINSFKVNSSFNIKDPSKGHDMDVK